MSANFAQGYALLIGVDESMVADAALPDVKKDVAALQGVLVHPERCGYPAAQVKAITGTEATRGGILDGLAWLQEQVEADASENVTAVVYYSGHGWRTADGDDYYLIPYDVNEKRVALSALKAEDFADEVLGLGPERLLVLLDCCHAGGMGVKKLPSLGGKFVEAVVPVKSLLADANVVGADGAKGFAQLQSGSGRAVLSSCRGEEESYIRSDGQMSIFTYHLIEALTGHAEPKEGATEVLVSDLLGHVYRRVPASAQADHEKPQNPEYVVSGNFPVALLLGGKGLSKGLDAPDPLASVEPSAPAMQATNTGSGAIAQGPGAVAAGERGVAIGGGVSGSTIVAGERNRVDQSSRVFDQRGQKVGGAQTNIEGGVNTGGGLFNTGSIDTGGGDLVGRDLEAQGLGAADLALLFAPILSAAVAAPAAQRDEAVTTVEALKAEVAKGKGAEDGSVARLIEGLVDLVPGAVSAVVSAFANPILAGVVGPVTKYVLGQLR